MEIDLLPLLARLNLVLAVAIALVLVLRAPVRRWCGARVAYALWLLPVVAAAMCFVPGRVEHVTLEAAAYPVTSAASAPEPPYLLWAWASGALLSLAVLAARQWRYTLTLGRLHVRDDLGKNVRASATSTQGPAVLGVLRPIIITPADFEARFDSEEQRIVLAHERAHMAQGDPLINAAVVVTQCLNWFNPMVHLGARALRMDQELAADAVVLEQAGAMRRRYAEAMLKAHVAAAAPLGCAWPPTHLKALKERIAMLKQALPSRTQRLLGGVAIVGVTALAAAAAWAAQPARVVATMEAGEAGYAADSSRRHVHEIEVDGVQVRTESGEGTRNRRVVIRNGEVISERDLTPEEQAEIERAVERANEAMANVNIDHERIRQQVEDAMDDLDDLDALDDVDMEAALSAADHAEIEASVRAATASLDHVTIPRHLTAEQQERVREALAEAREELADTRVQAEIQRVNRQAVRDAMAVARREMATARVQLSEMRRMETELNRLPHIQEALDEARAEIAEEAREARAEGDARRAEELDRAAQSLERTAREHNERRPRDDAR